VTSTLDPMVFGHRLRHLRRRRGLTLRQLGETLGRPPSYLSQLENGRREPRLSTVQRLADALGCPVIELLAPGAPDRRAELEMAVARMQEDPRYRALHLPHLRPSARTDDSTLEHLVTLYDRVCELQGRAGSSLGGGGSALGGGGSALVPDGGSARDWSSGDWSAGGWSAGGGLAPAGNFPGAGGGARQANAAMRREMRTRDNYFEEIEGAAAAALQAVGHTAGALSERDLTDLAAHFGFEIARVQDLPSSTRSIADTQNRIIYIPQRNNASTRIARSVVAQTLGRFALGHGEPAGFEEYVRQRVEANYFAGALLAPEQSVTDFLADAKRRQDISVEDLKEVFYISYEMAAHRLTNLITRHLDIPVHFQRSDPEGFVWKAYENDGLDLPADTDGTIEGQRVCRWWSARRAFESEDSYSMHYQYTTTPIGTFWSATHIEIGAERNDAVTVGTTEAHAHWFRGSDTHRRTVSRCPDPSCCRRPADDVVRRWDGAAWPSAKDHSAFVSGLPTDAVSFSPYPGVDLTDVYSFLNRHAPEP
jgi:transcriptional regulator with XRE-family HTH domain/predicted transcriptional regulator